jgi:hypothetical protein
VWRGALKNGSLPINASGSFEEDFNRVFYTAYPHQTLASTQSNFRDAYFDLTELNFDDSLVDNSPENL